MDARTDPAGEQRRLGEAAEDCLKATYHLQTRESPVATSALAARLGVADPTVTAMVKRLARLGLLYHTPYRGVQLTAAGERLALEIIRRHRLLELYLARSLGLSWDKVHTEAERLEHHVSDELEDHIDAALGYPTTDPHGDPIPTREGHIAQLSYVRLADLETNESALVRRIPDQRADLLQYLDRLGIVPGSRVLVLDKAPFGGPLTLIVGQRRHAIGPDLAASILVDREPPGTVREDAEL